MPGCGRALSSNFGSTGRDGVRGARFDNREWVAESRSVAADSVLRIGQDVEAARSSLFVG